LILMAHKIQSTRSTQVMKQLYVQMHDPLSWPPRFPPHQSYQATGAHLGPAISAVRQKNLSHPKETKLEVTLTQTTKQRWNL
jgi:hypothetical protein